MFGCVLANICLYILYIYLNTLVLNVFPLNPNCIHYSSVHLVYLSDNILLKETWKSLNHMDSPLLILPKVGDSPLLGCGGYANALGAVSATGHGEVPSIDTGSHVGAIYEPMITQDQIKHTNNVERFLLTCKQGSFFLHCNALVFNCYQSSGFLQEALSWLAVIGLVGTWKESLILGKSLIP